MSDPVDLALGILDHQLVDSEGRRCGKVDDLELELGDDPRVTAILVGSPAWRRRSRLGTLLARLAGGVSVRVSWDEVASVDSAVHLRREARELRLARWDERARAVVERLPGSDL